MNEEIHYVRAEQGSQFTLLLTSQVIDDLSNMADAMTQGTS